MKTLVLNYLGLYNKTLSELEPKPENVIPRAQKSPQLQKLSRMFNVNLANLDEGSV